MTTIVTRVGKGSPLTTQELDANFTNLNTDKLEKSLSGYSAATTLVGTELLPIVQDGETKKAAMSVLSIAVRNYLLDSGADLPITPDYLFSHGEQGTWYDPSDFSSMYQDSAGTTPVTAVEQPVGKVLDKSGNGNHATQSTTTSRPILRSLYNLLTYTEQFDNAYWTQQNASISSGYTDPLGGTTAQKYQVNTTNNQHGVYKQSLTPVGRIVTVSVYAKAGEYAWVLLGDVAGNGAFFDLQNGAIGSPFGNGSSSTITNAGNGWYRIQVTLTSSSPTAGFGLFVANADNSISFAGANTTDGIYIWGASLVPANEASLPYQRVVTNTLGSGVYDSDVTKFPPYLYFDGTDDFLVTGNINFSATDKMSVFAGVRKLVAGAAIAMELGPNINTTNGTFQVVQADTSTGIAYASRGSSIAAAGVPTSGFTAPITAVLTAESTISTDYCVLRINGAQVASDATNQGTGNYASAQPLYIGRRGGTTLPFSGRIYSLITRGALTTTPLLEKTEQWVAAKTGVTL